MNKTVLIIAAGTAGHIFPAAYLASWLADELSLDVRVWTDQRGNKYCQMFPDLNVSVTLGANKLRYLLSLPMQMMRLVSLRPSLVIGFGTYKTLGGLLAAKIMCMRTSVHEQNALMGRANRIARLFVNQVWVTNMAVSGKACPAPVCSPACHPASAPVCHPTCHPASAPVCHPTCPPSVAATAAPLSCSGAYDMGMPMSDAFVSHPAVPYTGRHLCISIWGGSLGAGGMGRQVADVLCGYHHPDLHIFHQTSHDAVDEITGVYKRAGVSAEIFSFTDNVAGYMGQSHLVIARSGASMIANIASVGRPSVLVPLPWAKDDHQTHNAEYMEKCGAAFIVKQQNIKSSLLSCLDKLADQNTLADMGRRALGASIKADRGCVCQHIASLIKLPI